MSSTIVLVCLFSIWNSQLVTTGEETTEKGDKENTNGDINPNTQLGILIRDTADKISNETAVSNLTREFRKGLIKRLKEAKDMLDSVCRAKEQYAVCSMYSEKLQKTAEFLDIYHKEVNETYNAIFNIIHGQPDQISKANLNATLKGINETLKEQVCEELKQFAVRVNNTESRDRDF